MVSPMTTSMESRGKPSSCAAIWAMAVLLPWPFSTAPTNTCTFPDSNNSAAAEYVPPTPTALQPVPMPTPLFQGEGGGEAWARARGLSIGAFGLFQGRLNLHALLKEHSSVEGVADLEGVLDSDVQLVHA